MEPGPTYDSPGSPHTAPPDDRETLTWAHGKLVEALIAAVYGRDYLTQALR